MLRLYKTNSLSVIKLEEMLQIDDIFETVSYFLLQATGAIVQIVNNYVNKSCNLGETIECVNPYLDRYNKHLTFLALQLPLFIMQLTNSGILKYKRWRFLSFFTIFVNIICYCGSYLNEFDIGYIVLLFIMFSSQIYYIVKYSHDRSCFLFFSRRSMLKNVITNFLAAEFLDLDVLDYFMLSYTIIGEFIYESSEEPFNLNYLKNNYLRFMSISLCSILSPIILILQSNSSIGRDNDERDSLFGEATIYGDINRSIGITMLFIYTLFILSMVHRTEEDLRNVIKVYNSDVKNARLNENGLIELI